MGQLTSAHGLFHTTFNEVVYFKNFLLSVILRPKTYPLLMVTFPFKESYIVHRYFQKTESQLTIKLRQRTAMLTVTDSKFSSTEGNVASVL